ncbi:DEAD/DEAH box helicase family protein [Novosphingobium sp.]|uniref:DEAD/DEAH box helicase family protein n=1 Tax=Novosphingobium sp. TaxID=1874826 RepID=UPI0035B0AE7A
MSDMRIGRFAGGQGFKRGGPFRIGIVEQRLARLFGADRAGFQRAQAPAELGAVAARRFGFRMARLVEALGNPQLEWMKCTVSDVQTVLTELRTGKKLSENRSETFPPRQEQAEAVEKTASYFQSIWNEDANAVPRFLWNAKMRFGKTFTSYQLAKKLGAKRVLVVTFKPAVEDAWQTDLESHVDFEGWQYLSRKSESDPSQIDKDKPVVFFGSFQDLLGRDKATGAIKPRNEWLHTINWDLVVFDEYHFGAWRDTAKELFEGEEDAKREEKLEYDAGLDEVNEDLSDLSANEAIELNVAVVDDDRVFAELSHDIPHSAM